MMEGIDDAVILGMEANPDELAAADRRHFREIVTWVDVGYGDSGITVAVKLPNMWIDGNLLEIPSGQRLWRSTVARQQRRLLGFTPTRAAERRAAIAGNTRRRRDRLPRATPSLSLMPSSFFHVTVTIVVPRSRRLTTEMRISSSATTMEGIRHGDDRLLSARHGGTRNRPARETGRTPRDPGMPDHGPDEAPRDQDRAVAAGLSPGDKIQGCWYQKATDASSPPGGLSTPSTFGPGGTMRTRRLLANRIGSMICHR
jgi:hypothetical protein